MSIWTRLVSRMFELPPAVAPKLECQTDLRVPMPDGAVLLANRIAPRGGAGLPIVLMRSPYGERGAKPDLVTRLIAERGYQVVVQSCRGTFGSDGEFRPFEADRDDGLATLRWLGEQPWFGGAVAMFGLSYPGYAQLAAGADAPAFLKALVPQMSASRLYPTFRANGTLSLSVALTWHYQTYVTHRQETNAGKMRATTRRDSVLRKAAAHLPLGDADRVALGQPAQFFQELTRQEHPDDELWMKMDHSARVKDIEAPVHFVAGWYDFFLASQLADYQSMREAGKNPYLTVGGWPHVAMQGIKVGLQESFTWYDVHLRGNRAALRASPVRVFVMGSDEWVDLASWPPPSTATRWHLRTGGRLSPDACPPGDPEMSRYRYDPTDPTPSVGGAVVFGGGAKDNRKLEARPDVLTFTSEPMADDTRIMGSVSAELHVRSSNQHTDFVTRLCDVSPAGRSVNICDGFVRLAPGSTSADADGVHRVVVTLSPTAHCFRKGHRIRLQLSSGAHPVINRNLGTGEPLATGVAMRVADQEVFHDAVRPSAVVLPVSSALDSPLPHAPA